MDTAPGMAYIKADVMAFPLPQVATSLVQLLNQSIKESINKYILIIY
jgi:hypothetical protein